MRKSGLLTVLATFVLLMVFAYSFFQPTTTNIHQIPDLSFYGRPDFEIFGGPFSGPYEIQSIETSGDPWFVSVFVKVDAWSHEKSPMQLQIFLPKDLEGKVRLDVKSWLFRNNLVDREAIIMDFSMYKRGYAAGFRFWQPISEPLETITIQLIIVPEDNVQIPEKYKNGLLKEDIKIYSEKLIDKMNPTPMQGIGVSGRVRPKQYRLRR